MTRILKTSGFLGLAVMMSVGLHQTALLAGGGGPPGWMIGAHAHLGVLSIIGIVTGFAVEALGVTGNVRTAVTGLFLVGQWLLPATIWLGEGAGMLMLMPTMFVWGGALVVAMLLMTWQTATGDTGSQGRSGPITADD
ncbi:hypothetical protein ACFQJD_17870 [Haloplanus sp. GCM10025708]|uniref:hypothetical protein n=1 Tax=Haloferacaceae TaxID=1644056 RepID=UPI00361D73A8